MNKKSAISNSLVIGSLLLSLGASASSDVTTFPTKIVTTAIEYTFKGISASSKGASSVTSSTTSSDKKRQDEARKVVQLGEKYFASKQLDPYLGQKVQFLKESLTAADENSDVTTDQAVAELMRVSRKILN